MTLNRCLKNGLHIKLGHLSTNIFTEWWFTGSLITKLNIIKHLLHVCLKHREHDATVQNPVGSSHVAQTQHQWPVAWVHTVNVGQWLPSRHRMSGDSICCIVPASKTVYLTHIEILSGMLKFPSVTRHSSWEQVLQMGSRKSKC